MDTEFCCNDKLLKSLSCLLSETLFSGISNYLLEQRYQEIKINYGKKVEEWKKNFLYEYNEFADMKLTTENINDNILSSASDIGIDMPVWFNFNNATGGRIMLVGMEPLRKHQESGVVTISSPFGIHCYNNKRNPSRRLIEKFIQQLLKNNNALYLTDANKTYSRILKKKYVGVYETNKYIFLNEVDLIKPDYIIAFGNAAFEKCNSYLSASNSTNLLKFAHPAAWRGNKKYFEIFCDYRAD